MLQLILKTHLAFLLIPLLTLAMAPNNPVTFCDRFLNEADKAACVTKTNQNHADWYASAACSLLEDDNNFTACLDQIKGASYSPEALELCAKTRNLSDALRMSCLQKIKNKDYTRAQIKTCSDLSGVVQITQCLSSSSKDRAPASHPTHSRPAAGFQSVEIAH